MIIVLTGQPRHGKSQYAIKLLLDFIKDNQKRLEQGKLPRDIYCNIAGVNDPNTKIKLPEVQNQDIVYKDKKLWFGEHKDCPYGYVCPNRGSVFIYDECHKVEWIKEKSGTLSQDLTCISMNEHGHEDYIFILITQFPQYIHTHLRGLVEFHYHSKRLFGAKGSKIYKWNEFQLSPRSDKALKDAFETDKFSFKKKYQDCYQSASAHDSMKLHLPKSVVYAFMLIACLFMAAFWRYQNSNIKEMVDRQNGVKTAQTTQASQGASQDNEVINSHEPSQSSDDKSIQEKYDDSQTSRRIYLYEQDLPQDYMIRRHDPYLQIRGVIQRGDKCQAYNQFGDLMTLSQQDCKSYVGTGRVYKPDMNVSTAPTSEQASTAGTASETPVQQSTEPSQSAL